MLAAEDLQVIVLSLKLALSSTFILLVICTPLAWWLARSNSKLRFIINSICTLPLVLPPTVLGFYLLLALSPTSGFGSVLKSSGIGPLVFSFWGLVLASCIYSLPFVLQPIRNAFASIPTRTFESASSLGAKPLDAFTSIALPIALPGYISAAVLGFAHTLGEFGLVLMIGGNIPNETRTASIQIYNYVEALQYDKAHNLALILLCIAFLVVLFLSWYQQKKHLTLSFSGVAREQE